MFWWILGPSYPHMSRAGWHNSKKLDGQLRRKLKPGPERGGVVLPGGRLLEFPNVSPEPGAGFQPQLTTETVLSLNDAVGTWHTHPDASANLSVEDSQTFQQWPDLLHAVIGTDGIRWYAVKNGAVVNA